MGNLLRRWGWLAFILVMLVSYPAMGEEVRRWNVPAAWQTLETEHFAIHFHQGESTVAMRVAGIAEEAYSRLSPFLEVRPGKTQVVLRDASDDANGWVSETVPYNNVTLYISEPGATDWSSLGFGGEEWLRYVFVHEYTHVLLLDTVNGLSEDTRDTLGRVPILGAPNAYLPAWYVEGLSTYTESSFTRGGRVGDPVFRMYLLAAAAEDRLYRNDQVASVEYELEGWPPAGLGVYLYGSAFMGYLAETYGPEDFARLNHAFASVPDFSRAFAGVYGQSLNRVWADWQGGLKREAEKLEMHRYEAFREARYLTGDGYQKRYPVFSPDGRYVAYLASGRYQEPALFLYNTENGKSRRLREGITISEGRPAWSPDGQYLVFVRPSMIGSDLVYHDLYRVDLKTGKETALTRRERASEPAISPDGRWLAYTSRRTGGSDLVMMDLVSGEKRVVLGGTAEKQFTSPDWSPDGKLLAVIWRNGQRDLILVNPDGKQDFVLVTDDPLPEISPAWVPDGRIIYTGEDTQDGLPVLMAINPDTGSREIIGRDGFGALEASVSPDGREMAYLAYGADGFEVKAAKYAPEEWLPLTMPGEQPSEGTENDGQPARAWEQGGTHPYRAWPTLSPQWVLGTLDFSANSYGNMDYSMVLVTGGIDALQEQAYSVYLSEGNRGLDYTLGYQRLLGSVWRPLLTLEATRQTNDDGTAQTGQMAEMTFPVQRSALSATDLLLGATHVSNGGDYVTGAYGQLAHVWVRSWPEWRWTERLVLDGSLESIGRTDASDGVLEWRSKAETTGGEISWRALTGTSRNYVERFDLGGTEENWGSRDFPVRGFKSGSMSGDRALLGSLEYSPTLWRIGKSLSGLWTYAEKIRGTLFVDAGLTGNGADWEPEPLVSAGAEVTLQWVTGYRYRWALGLGWAAPLTYPERAEASHFYFRINLAGL